MGLQDPKSSVAKTIQSKAAELSVRVSILLAEAESDGEIEFAVEMIRESEKAISFWIDLLEKEVRK